MRFSKRVKVFPGFSLNFSGSGISTTVGPRGASINISKRGTYFNGSFPGTGVSSRIRIVDGQTIKTPTMPELHEYKRNDHNDYSPLPIIHQIKGTEIKSGEIEEMTSSNLQELKHSLSEAYTDLNLLPLQIALAKKEISKAKTILLVSKVLLIGFFIGALREKLEDKELELESLEEQLSNTFVDVDVNFEEQSLEKFNELKTSFIHLSGCQYIWDKTSYATVDARQRSAAGTSITRERVLFNLENVQGLTSSQIGMHLENKNGGDMYIYAGFVVMIDKQKNFALIDIKELEIKGTISKFLEEEAIPSDSEQIGTTWAKVNNDGSRDKRFSGNYQIPILQYGVFTVKSKTGLEESYMVSNWKAVQSFCESFEEYKKIL